MNGGIGTALQAALGHLRASRLREARAILHDVLRLDPVNAPALHMLGVVLLQSGEHAGAADLLRKAIAAGGDGAMLRNNLAIALKALGRLDDAIGEYRRALALDPGNPELHCNLATALQAAGDSAAAVAGFERAIALRPQFFEAHFNLGNALKDRGELGRAVASFDRALALRPGHPDAEVNRGMTLLLEGEYGGGWQGYEYRFDRRGAPGPFWRGAPVRGKTLLLTAEQGFGDTLQFVRYVPLAAAAGATVALEVQPELHRLLHRMEGAATVLARGTPRPAFDLQCPLPSLPLAFATRLDSIPAAIPYIVPDPLLVTQWRDRLDPARGGARVGLAWAGSPTHVNDRNRSLPPAELGGLAGVPDVRFFSLQKGTAARATLEAPPVPGLKAVGDELADFADTAAVVANLDLVIAVDTSVAHLAGAMGRPVWVLLPHAPDWRWLLGRDDSPWYPHARLFRQPAPGDWESVVRNVRAALEQWRRDCV
jgi:Flp pilus assembly protein TadD